MTEEKVAVELVEAQKNIDTIISTIRVKETPHSFDMDRPEVKKPLGIEVMLPKTGGILTQVEGKKYPSKGFPYSESVQKVDDVKKTAIALASGFSDFRGKWILAIFVLLFRGRIKKSAQKIISHLYRTVEPHCLKPFFYCKAVREVYQAFDKADYEVRDIVCMVLEFDDCYRYRFQDVFGELDKAKFKKNPIKEISRILKLLESRESDKRLKEMWKMLDKLLFISFFVKEIREKIIDVMFRLNPKNIKMDEADKYHAKFKGGYKFNFGN